MSDPIDLGEGWYQYTDETGRAYFHNTITQATQWEVPNTLLTVGEGDYGDEYGTEYTEEAPASDFADMYLRDSDADAPAADYLPQVSHSEPPPREEPKVSAAAAAAAAGKSQFAEAMSMLKKQGIFDGGGSAPAPAKVATGAKPHMARETSQFHESLKALRSQGVDAPGTSGINPSAPPAAYQARRGSSSSGPRPNFAHDMGLDASAPDPQSPPSVDLMSELTTGAPDHEDEEGMISPELDELLAAPSAPMPPSHPEWETVTFQAVVFVWYETNSNSRTEPLFPGNDGNLQVGPIHVAWQGLSMSGPGMTTATVIPYENIVMWTLHLEETCLDLTLDGTFKPDGREIEWWTGSVLELRCCLSSTDATVALGNKIKEVCMKKAKETKATDLNKSAIAAAAATLSHQVNTTTPMQRRASLSRKPSVTGPPPGGAPGAKARGSSAAGDPLAELQSIGHEAQGSRPSTGSMDGYYQGGGAPAPQPEKKKKNMAQKVLSKASKMMK